MDPSDVFKKIEGSRDEIVQVMTGMIRIPAISPISGGEGESKRADYLQNLLQGYDSVRRIDVRDDTDPNYIRSNILARKEGKGKGTVWIVAHMDTVPAGDLSDWKTSPFEAVYKDGRIYGRGTEDNGQAVVSAMFASKFIPKECLEKRSIGIAYVADEENSSTTGIVHLIENGYFSKDDVFLVPDWGSPDGTQIDVREKNVVWLQFDVKGISTHGSTPEKGINAYKVGVKFMADLMDVFEKEYDDLDDSFCSSCSTFEPTKSLKTVSNVNTIPGNYTFTMDIRMIPCHNADGVKKTAREIADKWEKKTGAKITVTEVLRHTSGKPSSTDGEVFLALSDSIEAVIGKRPRGVGVGGATCANFFRLKGYDAYVWEFGGGTLHGPNEYVVVDHIITDAKVFASLFLKLCF